MTTFAVSLSPAQTCWQAIDEIEMEWPDMVEFFEENCPFTWPPICQHLNTYPCSLGGGGYYMPGVGGIDVCIVPGRPLAEYKMIIMHELQHAFQHCDRVSRGRGCGESLCDETEAYYCEIYYPVTSGVDWTYLSQRAWGSAKNSKACCQERSSFPDQDAATNYVLNHCVPVHPSSCWQSNI